MGLPTEEVLSAGHAEQILAPAIAENWLAGHGVQEVAPTSAENCPAGQGEHEVTPATENCPTGH